MNSKIIDYEISDDRARMQISIIHRWLKDAYWCKGIPENIVKASVENSICFGVFKDSQQVGFGRVVTDCVTFAWICDIFIDEEHRGRGLSIQLMHSILNHPKLQNLRRICLATLDANKLYEKFGFKEMDSSRMWMEIKDSNIYLR